MGGAWKPAIVKVRVGGAWKDAIYAMVNSIAQAEAWFRSNPPNDDDGSWVGWCARACYRSLGDPTLPSAGNATQAGNMSARDKPGWLHSATRCLPLLGQW